MSRSLLDRFSAWIDTVAGALVGAAGRLGRRRSVTLVETEPGRFVMAGADAADSGAAAPIRLDDGGRLPAGVAARIAGRAVALELARGRFLFRPLDLPRQAAAFLDGIVRAQLDRLTPWHAGDAVYGWTPPAEAAGERIALTVAATARTGIAPLLDALTREGARTIVVAVRPDDAAAPVRVLEHALPGRIGIAQVRRALLAVLIAAALAAVAATLAEQIVGADLDASRADLDRRIAARRIALLAARGGGDAATAAVRALEQRKHDGAPTVLVLEALSRALPDHTFVTEMHIEGDKVQVMGLSRDAPALIRLLEQSSNFTRATFYAPTTRAAEDPGERFHIEARIRAPIEVTP
ncbi:PilN domain-containing protein [Rhodoplanes sp. TEM]|uniref:PilN domain-containing protein n=1 Tax=Rhodoplanes tepidamans TaxID=200616 RepID=A0ABT5JCW1_RHOTP|nr:MULTISPECIES: PilN domain-containing protein [Rhodoplanes]MDC7787293.1 PilN domain-containing protein [Rhodoplanes tepidamans]MDC7985321.1 PilN domain-containing protein [Rhodoplanes sp. TEM]MDQ0357828.1 general secretion pathway protein L [Rhodoplanes tepidamans]